MAKIVSCQSLPALAQAVGFYRKNRGTVLQFDDPKHLHMGFCSEDQAIEWRLSVWRFIRHFDTKKAAVRAFKRRRDFVFELGAALNS
jgi:hypothetical protein